MTGEGPEGSDAQQAIPEPAVSLWPGRSVVSWGALGGALPAGQGR